MSEVIETNEYFEARRGFLVQLYSRVRISTFVVAPALVTMYAIHIFRYPCWQTKVLFGVALALAACFVLAAIVANRGNIVMASRLIVISTAVELSFALVLREGSAASTSIALVALLAYVALFSQRALKRAALAGGIVLFFGTLLAYLEIVLRFRTGAREQLITELGFIVVFVWAIGYLLRQGQIISALLFEEMRRTTARQVEVIQTIGAIEPRLRATIEGLQKTADVLAVQAGEQATTSGSINLSTSELASMVDTTVAAVEETRGLSDQTREASLSSRDKLKAVEDAFSTAVGRIETVRAKVDELAEQIASTEEVNRAIQEIAENLKVLSVNASIESAKAGEHGRGFGVIAEELRRMIIQSSGDLVNSGRLLEAIRKEAGAIAEEAGTSTRELRECFGELRVAGGLIQEITQSYVFTTSKVEEIAGAAQNQQALITAVSAAMRQFDAAAGQLTAATETLTDGVVQIDRVGGALREILASDAASQASAEAAALPGGPVGAGSTVPGDATADRNDAA